MRSQLLLIPAVLLALAIPVSAAIYKHVDENGKITYTDQPPKGEQAEEVEKLDVQPVNTTQGVEPTVGSSRPTPSEPQQQGYTLNIVSPQNDTQLPPGQRDLTVAIQSNRKLAAGHTIYVLLNGQIHPNVTGSAFNQVLMEIPRGTHKIQASIVNETGKQIAASNAVTIHVIRQNVPRASHF